MKITLIRKDEEQGREALSLCDTDAFFEKVKTENKAGHISELTKDILRCGKIPYYGTGMSHIASQRVAAAAGYDVFWFELLTGK